MQLVKIDVFKEDLPDRRVEFVRLTFEYGGHFYRRIEQLRNDIRDQLGSNEDLRGYAREVIKRTVAIAKRELAYRKFGDELLSKLGEMNFDEEKNKENILKAIDLLVSAKS